MAVISRARKRGLQLTLHDVLQSNSVKELAETAGASVPVSQHEEKTGEYFCLSPIQDLYFRSSDACLDDRHFNQSMTVRITRKVEPDAVKDAIMAVVNQHSMLRARFNKSATGTWQQKITQVRNTALVSIIS